MAPDSVTMHFPNGAWEYGFMDKLPAPGDTLLRQGVTWMVTDVADLGDEHHEVTMARAPAVQQRNPRNLES